MNNIFTLHEFVEIMKNWEQIIRFKEGLYIYGKNINDFSTKFHMLQ